MSTLQYVEVAWSVEVVIGAPFLRIFFPDFSLKIGIVYVMHKDQKLRNEA